ncbi:hypothetical protein AB1L16_06885 [Peribacillus frigoritolerans]|uniref:hypothetical protein n=1 Tax=Peribacillus frigoritolerans TaxID=450367 RepID=UPI0039A30270
MSKFLDLRTTQNASYANSIAIPISGLGTPEFIGQLGLDVNGASGTIRVGLYGTVAVQLPLLPLASSITLTVVEGTNVTPQQGIVYSATQVLEANLAGPTILTFNGTRFNAPVPPAGQVLAYTLFITTNALGLTRVGPESFSAIAVSD